MSSKTVQVTILKDGNLTGIPVPFDPKEVFGKVRAPVTVTLNGYTYRSTIARMGGQTFIPLRKSHRVAAGVEGGSRVEVLIAADTDERVVELPADLCGALGAKSAYFEAWQKLSYTNQREAVESVLGAKKPETRTRRIARVVETIASKVSS